MENQTEYRKGKQSVGLNNRIRLQNPLLLTDPTITGTPEDGETLTANIGTYRVGATVTGEEFQWYRNGLPIDGETTDEYVLVTADVGQLVKCRIRVLYGDQYHYWFTAPELIEA